MNDKELADAVVTARVGRSATGEDGTDYEIPGEHHRWVPAKYFVRDPRVAMVLMEKCITKDLWLNIFQDAHNQFRCNIELMVGAENKEITDIADDDSLPRAITEACVEALT